MIIASARTSLDDPLDRAAAMAVRLAVRGHGRVEPNPMVGCTVLDRSGALVGWGFHRRVGGDHAEVEALRRAGERARGGTLLVTLEPCGHHGRTPPCTDAILRAGVSRVIFSTVDPNPVAAGGAAHLRAHGVAAELRRSVLADHLNAPFIHRVTTGLPWLSAKWAQTIDGAIAARSGVSRWISSERLRRRVHRERARVDAVITGIGTVHADDPMLTPRDVAIRRMPLRVVVDPELTISPQSNLVSTASLAAPVVVAAPHDALTRLASRVRPLEREGLHVLGHDGSLRSMLTELARRHSVSRALVECGGGLLGALAREGLVNECWVIIAPMLAADPQALRAMRGFQPADPEAMMRRALVGSWRCGDEMLLLYR